jgi:hypothetical protein
MADCGNDSELASGSASDAPPLASSQEPRPPAAVNLAAPARGFVRFLYSSNPFYILSADLVFVGLKMSFGSRGPASQTWALLLGLAGYTLLMGVTACYLIRAGKLWDDLRSLLIVIVMMFMTMAMSGDDTLASNPGKGTLGCLGGLLFAVIVTEAILRTIRLALPGWYRAAYYLILALMFLYPIALIPLVSEPDSPRLQWALFGFPVFSGLVLTALAPAARRGAAYVALNGSPWRWPLFPWSLFLIMAGILAVRSYSLCVSFHYVGGTRTIFAPYFLVPIGLAVSLVWLEIGIASGRRGVMFLASALPLILAAVAMNGHRYEPIYLRFLGMFMDALGGSPAFLTLVAALVFHSYAAARKAPLAIELMCVTLVGLAMVGRRTVMPHEISPLWSIPLIAAGLILGLIALRCRLEFRALVAGCLLVFGLTRACGELWPAAPLQSIGVHLAVAALLVLGACFRGWLLVLGRTICVLVLTALGVSAVLRLSEIEPLVPAAIMPWYPLFVIVTGVAYGRWLEQPLFVACAMVTLASWGLEFSRHTYQQLRRLVSGLDQISAGICLFIVALAISLRKAGLLPRIDIGALIRRILDGRHEVPAKRWWEADDVQVSPPAAPDAPP